MLGLKTDSTFVFAAYTEQLQRFYARSPRPWTAQQVGDEFNPDRLGDWFFERLVAWSRKLPRGHATTHIFRKTTLQFARRGEDLNKKVAEDACVSETVMMTSYVEERDEELRQASNRTFHRLLASIAPEIAHRYGHQVAEANGLERRLKSAVQQNNWSLVAEISTELALRQQ